MIDFFLLDVVPRQKILEDLASYAIWFSNRYVGVTLLCSISTKCLQQPVEALQMQKKQSKLKPLRATKQVKNTVAAITVCCRRSLQTLVLQQRNCTTLFNDALEILFEMQ